MPKNQLVLKDELIIKSQPDSQLLNGYILPQYKKIIRIYEAIETSYNMSWCMRFPTMWHFNMCRLGRASAASF